MDRNEFIKTCGMACTCGIAFATLLESCAGSKMVSGSITGENIVIPISEFEQIKKEEKTYRKYIIVQNDQLKYPICVYRFSETEYSALLMRCTHQGNELSALGDKLHCSAHGSEFDKKGSVTNGPADKSLKSFPVTIENQQLKISLKAI